MKQQTGWCLIPPHIIANENLSANEKLVFGRIMGLSNKFGYCTASNYWLGKQLGLDDGTIKNIIISLKKQKLLDTKVKRDDKNHIIKRYIFVRESIGQCPDGHAIMPRWALDNAPYSVECSVERVENFPFKEKAKLYKEKHTNKKTFFPTYQSSRTPTQYPAKKSKVYVDGSGII